MAEIHAANPQVSGPNPATTKEPGAALSPCEYKTGKTLGQGSYGVVKEGVKISTGERFAVKMISKKLMRGKESLILNEINILKKVSKGNKNVVTLHDYFESPNNLYLVMDLCTGGELFDRIIAKGYFYEEDAAKIVRTVCSAITYLHQNNIVHRDLKPENLIFRSQDEDSDLLIADFGLSRITNEANDNGLSTYAGTPGYMAPEIIQKKGHGKPVDLWAIGVMAYFLLAGVLPFESSSNAEEVDNVVNARYSYDDENWRDISVDAKNFIDSLIILDPAERLKAEECLTSSWLSLGRTSVGNKDLLPIVRSGFDARKAFKKAVDVVLAVTKLNSRTPSRNPSRNPSMSNIHPSSISNTNLPSMSNITVNDFLDPSRNPLGHSTSHLSLGNGDHSKNVSQTFGNIHSGMPASESLSYNEMTIDYL